MTIGFFDEKIGTPGDDNITGSNLEIIYSLQGNDTLSSSLSFDSANILVGGSDSDRYQVADDSGAIVLENGNSGGDRLTATGIGFNRETSLVVTIDNRHLVGVDVESMQWVIIIDWQRPENQIELFELSDGSFTYDQIANHAQITGAVNRSWYDFEVALVMMGLSPSAIEADINTVFARAKELELPKNRPPTLINSIPNQSIDEDNFYIFQIPENTFEDPEDDPLTYSASLSDGAVLPNWLSFDPTSRTFSGTPRNEDVAQLNLEVEVTDNKNEPVSTTFILTVNNTNDQPQVANPLADQFAFEDNPFQFQVPLDTFRDDDAIFGDTLTYTASVIGGGSFPSWLSFDSNTRTFSGTPTAQDLRTIVNVRVTATDSQQASVSNDCQISVEKLSDLKLSWGTPGDDNNPGIDLRDTPQRQIVFSGAGEDLINAVPPGSITVDRLYGGSGRDRLIAGTNDRLFGGTGDDTLDANDGGGGNRLYGSDGNDMLLAGGGNNLLSGGNGGDTFWIVNGELPNNSNIVTDFDLEADIVGIAGLENVNEEDLIFTSGILGAEVSIGIPEPILVAVFLGIDADELKNSGQFQFETNLVEAFG